MANKAKYTKTELVLAIQGDPEATLPKKTEGEDGWIKDKWLDNRRNSSHGHIPTIAKRLNCSSQTVRNYLSERVRLPEFKILNSMLKQIRIAIKEANDDDDAIHMVYELIEEMTAINVGNRFGLLNISNDLLSALDNPDVKINPILAEIKKQIACNTWGGFTKQAISLQEVMEQEKKQALIERSDFHHQLITDAEVALLTNVHLLDQRAAEFVLSRLDKLNFSGRSEITGADGVALFDDEARAALAELAELLDDIGKNPSEAIVATVQAMKAKIEAVKNKGKNDTHSMERGE